METYPGALLLQDLPAGSTVTLEDDGRYAVSTPITPLYELPSNGLIDQAVSYAERIPAWAWVAIAVALLWMRKDS